MRTVLNHTLVMDTVAILGAAPPSQLSLSMLSPGRAATVVSVGCGGVPSALEQRLLELGFVSGERVEVLAEARPGRDPFVVRVGSTTLALRRREVETVWVEP
jgi:ferrous iron transport protein A